MVPDAYAGKAQLRTLQRRVKQWRQNQAKELILGHLRRLPGASAGAAEVAEEATLWSAAPRTNQMIARSPRAVRLTDRALRIVRERTAQN